MEAAPIKAPRLLGIVGIGILQAGLSLYLSWQQIDMISKAPQLYYNWAMPLAFLSIVVAIAALMALYLIVRHRRLGLKLGLGVWAVSALLTLFSTAFMNAPSLTIQNIFYVTGGASLLVNIIIMYSFGRYLLQPPEKSVFV
jgi:hypothetical protein